MPSGQVNRSVQSAKRPGSSRPPPIAIAGAVLVVAVAVSAAVGLWIHSNSQTDRAKAANHGNRVSEPGSSDSGGEAGGGSLASAQSPDGRSHQDDGSPRLKTPGFFDGAGHFDRQPGSYTPPASGGRMAWETPSSVSPPPAPERSPSASSAPDDKAVGPVDPPLAAAEGPAKPKPARPIAADPRDRELAEQLYRNAKGAASMADAIAALQDALRHDPDHLQANLLLAELLIDKKELKPAIEQVARAKDAVARSAGASDEIKTRLAAVEKKLDSWRWPAGKWATDRVQYAGRYRALADTETASPGAAMVLALRRAAVLKPGDAALTALRDKAEAAMAEVPAAAEKADPDGAKRLHDKASQDIAASRFKEAQERLVTAVSLDPDQIDYWCDLAVCAQATKNVALAAACLLEADEQLAEVKDPETSKQFENRIRVLLERADSKMTLLAQVDGEVAKEGKLLIDRSLEIGDDATVEAIVADLNAMGMTVEAPAPRIAATKPPPSAGTTEAPARLPQPQPAGPPTVGRPPPGSGGPPPSPTRKFGRRRR